MIDFQNSPSSSANGFQKRDEPTMGVRCSREIRSPTNEVSQMRRELQTLQWSLAEVVLQMIFSCLWMIRLRLLNNGKTTSTIGTSVETISVQSSPPESPQMSPVDVTPTVPQETLCRASTEAISCCLVPTLSPCWIAVATQRGLNEQNPHSRNFQSCNGWCRRGGQNCNDGKDDVSLCADGGSNVVSGQVADARPTSCPCVQIWLGTNIVVVEECD